AKLRKGVRPGRAPVRLRVKRLSLSPQDSEQLSLLRGDGRQQVRSENAPRRAIAQTITVGRELDTAMAQRGEKSERGQMSPCSHFPARASPSSRASPAPGTL